MPFKPGGDQPRNAKRKCPERFYAGNPSRIVIRHTPKENVGGRVANGRQCTKHHPACQARRSSLHRKFVFGCTHVVITPWIYSEIDFAAAPKPRVDCGPFFVGHRADPLTLIQQASAIVFLSTLRANDSRASHKKRRSVDLPPLHSSNG